MIEVKKRTLTPYRYFWPKTLAGPAINRITGCIRLDLFCFNRKAQNLDREARRRVRALLVLELERDRRALLA